MSRYAWLAQATQHLEPPYAVIDLEALESNARAMAKRAGGTPIRLASKSVRCRAIQRHVLAMAGYRGVLAFTLPEALWLADEVEDVLVGYPTARRAALHTLAHDEDKARRVTVWSTRRSTWSSSPPRSARERPRSGSASTCTRRCTCSATASTSALEGRRSGRRTTRGHW